MSSAINSTSEILAATPKAVKAAYDLANGKQPADATLTALAGLATAADRLPYFTGADRAALATLTAIGRAIIAKGSIKDVLNYLGLGEGSALPVGVPVPWPTATPPAGWLKCDGRTFTKEQYPVLARVYPTLRLPDLRGEFIRGWDDGRKIDEGRKLLSWQKGTLVGGHDDNDSSLDISYMSNGNNIDYGGDKVFAGNYRSDYLWYAMLGGTNSRAKAELNGAFFNITRPRNIAFNYIVRAA
ncbi:phage tail protein [Escherichia coli]